MPQEDPFGFSLDNVLLEAEVAPSGTSKFQDRYREATGMSITPGNPPEYQRQVNKWGAECRVYFNSDSAATAARSGGYHVETDRPYRAEYRYRINDVDLWWKLVEDFEFRLGVN